MDVVFLLVIAGLYLLTHGLIWALDRLGVGRGLHNREAANDLRWQVSDASVRKDQIR